MTKERKTFVWAHRGASGYRPENTLPAFAYAAELGADGVELDIQLTKDGEIVVCHDEMLDRTSNHKGWLKDYTLEELKRFDFCNGNAAYEGVQIPTMREVFDLLKDTGLVINIELKTGIVFYENIEEKILELAKECGWGNDRLIYSSFNHYSVQKIKELDPQAQTGLLYADGYVDMPGYGEKMGVNALHPALYNLQYPGFLAACAKKNLDLNVWTVNATEHIQMCVKAGVNAIIGNYPNKIRKVIEDMA